MSVVKRGKYWHYSFMINGERYHGTTRETNQRRAQTFESYKIGEVLNGNLTLRPKRIPFLHEFAQQFLDYVDARAAAGTLGSKMKTQYHQGWRLLSTTTIPKLRIDQITCADAAVLTFTGGPWNARVGQKTLKRILVYAEELGLIQAAPRILLSKAYGRNALIDPEMESKLIKEMDPDVAALFTIMMDSGQRPDEVMRMEWSNVHYDRQAIFIPSGKTPAARRFVPLSDRVAEILRQRQVEAAASIARLKTHLSRKKISAKLCQRRTEAITKWVFPGRTEEGRRNSIAKQFDRAREAAGVRAEIVLYCARHTFATNLLSETGDLALVQRVMGHESITTTQKYLHPETSGVAAIVNKRNARTGQLHLVA